MAYTFAEYQLAAARTATPVENGADREHLANFALGLTGEAGEVADAIKKHLFHGRELDRDHIAKELGDVLWYLSMLANTLGFEFAELAEKNVAKLKARYPDGFSVADSEARRDEAGERALAAD
jgi:NTP pyrophosphatase (non-canonical NTP hydrolase)